MSGRTSSAARGGRGPRRKVRLALIGAGNMANTMHYPSLSEMRDVEMAAICDLDEGKAKATAARFAIPRVYGDYRRMLDEVKPEAVYALMPPQQVFGVAVETMSRGCHLFIEKPPGLNAYQNRMLAHHAGLNGVIAMAGFQRRYVPLIEALRQRVAARGPLHTVEVEFIKCSPDPLAYYGGAIDILSCDGVHAVDTLRHLAAGDFTQVAGIAYRVDACAPNAFQAVVTFSTGVVGVLKVNWACGHRVFRVAMHGNGISAYAEPDREGLIYRDGAEEPERFDPAECAGSDQPWRRLGFYDESREFIDCVKSGRKPLSSLEDTVRTMELVERVLSSGRSGQAQP